MHLIGQIFLDPVSFASYKGCSLYGKKKANEARRLQLVSRVTRIILHNFLGYFNQNGKLKVVGSLLHSSQIQLVSVFRA